MFDFLKIPSLLKEPAEALEPDLEQEKRDRIKFHRESVRNGPVNFKTPTNGQIRRAQKRDLASRTKKARRRQVQNHFVDRYESAILRAHLQHAGIINYANPQRGVEPQLALTSITWIVEHFTEGEEGEQIEVTYDVVVKALTSAYNRWQTLMGLPVTPLSPSYRLPVAIDGAFYDEIEALT